MIPSAKATAASVTFVSLLILTTVQIARKYRISTSTSPPSTHVDSLQNADDTVIVSIEHLSEPTIGTSPSGSASESNTEPANPAETKAATFGIEVITDLELQFPQESTAEPKTKGSNRPPPHIVFVLADDYGHSDIGYHGSWIKTPALDRLAAAGVKLENYYVQPICSPTRSQLLSGRYQIHTGLQHDIIEMSQPSALPLDSPTLADKLKEANYATHMVGKWHLGFHKKEFMPHYRGFDTFFGFLLGHGDHFSHKHKQRRKGLLDLRFNDQPIRNETGHYSTHLFTQKAIDVVRAHDKSKPLFLFLSYQAVHGPLQVPESYKSPYLHIGDPTRVTYAGMVAAMDEGIGNLTKTLKEEGMWDNTVFVFSSDNGGRVRKGASNYPLRGEKHSLWEGGVKSIGFVTGGRVKPKGAVTKELIHVSDWFPTLVKLAGGKLNGTKPLGGVDQWAAINEGKAGNRHVLLHNIDPLYARRGKAKYPGTFDSSIRAAVRVGDLKLITGDPDPGEWFPPLESSIREPQTWNPKGKKNLWLFNITADPNERTDLSTSRTADVRRLLNILRDFQKSSVPPYYPPFDRNAYPFWFHQKFVGPWM